MYYFDSIYDIFWLSDTISLYHLLHYLFSIIIITVSGKITICSTNSVKSAFTADGIIAFKLTMYLLPC